MTVDVSQIEAGAVVYEMDPGLSYLSQVEAGVVVYGTNPGLSYFSQIETGVVVDISAQGSGTIPIILMM